MDFEKEAREIVTACFAVSDATYDKPYASSVCQEAIAKQLAQVCRRAYAAGQEDMREQSAKEADYFCSGSATVRSIAKNIRAIPLGQPPKVNEFAPLATTKDIGLE